MAKAIRVEFESLNEMKGELLSLQSAINAYTNSIFARRKSLLVEEIYITFTISNYCLLVFASSVNQWGVSSNIECIWKEMTGVECFFYDQEENVKTKISDMFEDKVISTLVTKISVSRNNSSHLILNSNIDNMNDIDDDTFTQSSDRNKNYLLINSNTITNKDNIKENLVEIFAGQEEIKILSGTLTLTDKSSVQQIKLLTSNFISSSKKQNRNQKSNGYEPQSAGDNCAQSFFAIVSEEKIKEGNDLFSIKETNDSITRFSDSTMAYLNLSCGKIKSGVIEYYNLYPKNKIAFSKLCASIMNRQYKFSLSYFTKIYNSILFDNIEVLFELGDSIYIGGSTIENSFLNFYGYNIFCLTEFDKLNNHFNKSSENNYKSYRKITEIIMKNATVDIIFTTDTLDEGQEYLDKFFRVNSNRGIVLEGVSALKGFRFFSILGKWSAVKIGSVLILNNERQKSEGE